MFRTPFSSICHFPPSRGPLELYHLMSSWPPVTLHSISALDPSLTTMCLLEETLKDAPSASDPF